MTLTRWWLAGMMAVTLAATTGWAQTCGGPACGARDASRSAHVPYYNEVADILFPVCAPAPECPRSSPVVWQGLFNAVAHCQTEQINGCSRDAATNRTAISLQMARFYLRTGHYLTAEFYARLACKQNPNCEAAWQMLVWAAVAQAAEMIDDHEACEEPAPASAKNQSGCDQSKACAKGKDCCCDLLGDDATCGACAVKCGCAKNCGCGKDCCCDVKEVGADSVCLTGGDRGIRIVSKNFEATCDSLQYLPGDHDRVLLQGNACVNFKMVNRPARISAESIILNLTDGSFEFQPKNRR